MKQFTCTESVLKFAHPETGQLVVMHENDSLSLPDATVEEFCGLGWGTASGVTTGERKEGVVQIDAPVTTDTTSIVENG